MRSNYMVIQQVSELELYVILLQNQKKKVYTKYSELIEDLKYEFNISTTREQLDRMYSPTVEDESIDRALIYKNVME